MKYTMSMFANKESYLLAVNLQLQEKLDKMLSHCQDPECSECGKIICDYGDPLHFHHDGCPSCFANETS